MAHTPEQRDKHALCGSKKKNGDICRKFAGEGTEHFGYGRCKYHGGNTPNGKKNAVTIEAKRQMITLGAPIDVQPHDALVGLLRATAGHVGWLSERVANFEELSEHESQVILKLYDTERDRLT